MQNIILQNLKSIENTQNITILFACESGSRAWGFPSPDSDYDVRIIYVRNIDWYLSIENHADILQFPLENELDISGWDLRKALQIFRKSNAVIFEWLQSPIVYQNRLEFAHTLSQLMPTYFSPRTVIHHHLGLIHKSYSEIRNEKEIKLKKYFYILRSLLSALWVTAYGSVPPMEFKALTTLIAHKQNLMEHIGQLLILKAKADESTTISTIPILTQFIEDSITDCQTYAASTKVVHQDTDQLDVLFRQMVSQIS